MKKNKGFTLIELVVVIVILGILAAVAAPKFMDLQRDARISANNGLAGAMKSAMNMTYSKSILNGTDHLAAGRVCLGTQICTAQTQPTPNTEVILTMYGYPKADIHGIAASLQQFSSNVTSTTSLDNDWQFLGLGRAGRIASAGVNIVIAGLQKVGTSELKLTNNNAPRNSSSYDGCGVIYIDPADSDSAPTILVIDKDC